MGVTVVGDAKVVGVTFLDGNRYTEGDSKRSIADERIISSTTLYLPNLLGTR